MIKGSNDNSVQIGYQKKIRREDTLRVLFSDEKFFDIDVVYNCQNKRVEATLCADVDEKVLSRKTDSSDKTDGMVGHLLLGYHTLTNLG